MSSKGDPSGSPWKRKRLGTAALQEMTANNLDASDVLGWTAVREFGRNERLKHSYIEIWLSYNEAAENGLDQDFG